MDSHPPAGALTRYLRILSKNVESASAPSSQCRTFRFSEPPIIAALFASSTPHSEIRLRHFNQPEGISSKRAAYYDGLFLAVNTLSAVDLNFLRCWPRGRRRRSGSMCLYCSFVKSMWRFFFAPMPSRSASRPRGGSARHQQHASEVALAYL